MKKRILNVLFTCIVIVGLMAVMGISASAEDPHTDHCICGKTHANVGAHTAEVLTTFTAVTDQAGLQDAATSGGSVYLANDIKLTSTITVTGNLNLCLNGKTLSPVLDGEGNPAFNGRAFLVSSAVTFNLTDCTGTGAITRFNNTTDYDGGAGVLLKNNAKFNMYGGSISGNTSSSSGGGVAIYNSSVQVGLYGGSITGNCCGNYGLGGGLFGRENDTYVKIAGNPQVQGNTKLDRTTASNCSQVKFEIVGQLANTAKLSFYSESIDNSTISVGKYATNVIGSYESCFVHDSWYSSQYVCEKDTDGNISMFQFSKIIFDSNGGSGTMASQKVPLNQSTALNRNTFEHPDGKVFSYWSYNESGSGPDRYQDGGMITRHNTASLTLYAIWAYPTYNINKASTENGSFSVPTTQTVGATVTITATPATGYEVDTIKVYKTGDENTPVTVNDNKFTMPNYAVTVSVTFKESHTHCICGATHTDVGDHTTEQSVKWNAWDGTSAITYDSNNTAYVYLSADAARGSTLTVESGYTLYLCLNGKTLSPDSGFTGRAIEVKSGATFVLTDCGTTGAISGFQTASNGAGVHNSGTFTMYSGAISGNSSNGNGGGVYNSGTFTLYGGTITGNNAKSSGAGVYHYSGTFTMYGGAISNNESASFAGGVHNYGTFNMFGGSITGNTAGSSGGGVETNGIFNMYGGSITGNTADNSNSNRKGGGIFIPPTGTFKVSGNVQITGNKLGTNATPCNVYLNTDQFFTVTGNLTGDSNIGVTMHDDLGCFAKIDIDGATPEQISAILAKFDSDEDYPSYNEGNSLIFGYQVTMGSNAGDPYTVTVNSTEGVSYQWFKLIEDEFDVTPSLVKYYAIHGTYDSQTGSWTAKDNGYSGYFAIPMEANDTLTVVFAEQPGTPLFLYNQTSGGYASVTTTDNITYVFTAEASGTYMLMVLASNQPTIKATLNGKIAEPIDGQTAATLDRTNLPSGNYVCKVTWAMGTADTSDDYTLTSTPVAYTAYYTVTATSTTGGTVTGGGTYQDGATVTLTATPNSGYNFVNWTKNGSVVSTDATYTFTATETAEYVANFQQNTPSSPPAPSHVSVTLVYGNGIASETKRLPVDTGAPAAPAVNGKAFAGWYDDAACTQRHDFSTPFTADDTLYARYVEIPERSRVSFVADGRLVGIILYRPSQDELTVMPKVPAKEGYVGTWETYTLNGKNMVVRAVYTKE